MAQISVSPVQPGTNILEELRKHFKDPTQSESALQSPSQVLQGSDGVQPPRLVNIEVVQSVDPQRQSMSVAVTSEPSVSVQLLIGRSEQLLEAASQYFPNSSLQSDEPHLQSIPTTLAVFASATAQVVYGRAEHVLEDEMQ